MDKVARRVSSSQVLSRGREKLRVEWSRWRGEWFWRAQEEQENGKINTPNEAVKKPSKFHSCKKNSVP
jgi:hypothetical protein